MKGFTLIESLVVIAILSIIALVSMNTITEFQRNAILSSATQELGSIYRLAEADSSSGLVKTGETYSTLTPGTNTCSSDGFPCYGVVITSANSYDLRRYYTLNGASSEVTDVLETHLVDSTLVLSPTSLTLAFTRVTGAPTSTSTFPITITITRKNTSIQKSVIVNANGLISL